MRPRRARTSDTKRFGAIQITKTSTKGSAPLAGVTFDISTDLADANKLATVTTGVTGTPGSSGKQAQLLVHAVHVDDIPVLGHLPRGDSVHVDASHREFPARRLEAEELAAVHC